MCHILFSHSSIYLLATVNKVANATDGCWCQFNTNRSPQLGVYWRKKPYSVQNSSIVKQHGQYGQYGQHGCELALGPGPSPDRQLCSAPCSSALLWQTSLVFQLQLGKQSSMERESTLPESEGSWLFLILTRGHAYWFLERGRDTGEQGEEKHQF